MKDTGAVSVVEEMHEDVTHQGKRKEKRKKERWYPPVLVKQRKSTKMATASGRLRWHLPRDRKKIVSASFSKVESAKIVPTTTSIAGNDPNGLPCFQPVI